MNFFTYVGFFVTSVPFLILIGLLSALWRAWWLYPAWAWFIVPLGVPQTSFWHFVALVLLITVITRHIDTKKDPRKEDWLALFGVVIINPIVVWLLLWWLHR